MAVPCCPLVLLQRCTRYFSGDTDEIRANTEFFSSGGAKFGEVSCGRAPMGTVCEGDTRIVRPTPFYDEWGRRVGVYTKHGTVLLANEDEIEIIDVGTLDFDDSQNSDIFYQDFVEIRDGPFDDYATITGGTGKYVGATGYVEIISRSRPRHEIDVCLG
jgi:hypothetical protein